MSSIDFSSIFGSTENSNTRGSRKQTIQNAELMELSTSSPPSRFRNTDVSSPPSGRNQNNFDLQLDEVEDQQGGDESQLNFNDVHRIMLSKASKSEKQRNLEWIYMYQKLRNKQNKRKQAQRARDEEEVVEMALNEVTGMNPSSTPLLLSHDDDEDEDERPPRRPRLLMEAPSQLDNASLMPGIATVNICHDSIFKIIGLVKQRFITLNETSLFQETPILDNERLVKILLELSFFTSLEDFDNHIQVHLETISTIGTFVFGYCILFLKLTLLIKTSFSEDTLSFNKDFNLPQLVSTMSKLNLDMRCKNNQKKKEKEGEDDTVLEANPFGLFLDELESMTKGDVNNERMTRTIQLLNQCEDSDLYENWFEQKENKERVNILKQYEQDIFGLTNYPTSEQLLTQDKQSILTLLFLFFHFPVQNLYSMLFGSRYSAGSFNYWKINSLSRRKQLQSMTRFKKLVGSFSKNTSSSSSSGEKVTGSTEKKKRNNKLNCQFKDILDESEIELKAVETMFTEAKEDRNYTMVRLDVFRELFATMLIFHCGKEIFSTNRRNRRSFTDETLTLSISELSHHIRVNGSFFNISQGTGTKSSLETIVGNLLSLLPNPAVSNYNLLHYLYNHWHTIEAPAKLHEDNMSSLMTSQYEGYKRDYLLFMLGLSVF